MQRQTLLSAFFLALQFAFSKADEICKESSGPCSCKFSDGTTIELSSVGRPGMPRFVINNDKDFLLYNPCYPFNYESQLFTVDKHPCRNAAACVLSAGNGSDKPPTQRALGLQSTAVFFRDDDHHLKVNYSVPHVDENLTVILEYEKDIHYEFVINDGNKTVFVLKTFCVGQEINDLCKSVLPPSSSKSGLSTGSILLITFFVILLVYIGIGVLFNFCRGAHGTELLPNVEFWNELPKLIVDGFLFTCSCFGRRSSYADV